VKKSRKGEKGFEKLKKMKKMEKKVRGQKRKMPSTVSGERKIPRGGRNPWRATREGELGREVLKDKGYLKTKKVSRAEEGSQKI